MKNAQRTKKQGTDELQRGVLERLATVFKLLSESTRLAILHELRNRSQSVGELVATLGTSQANVSKQLRILFDHSILGRKQSGNQVFYEILEPGVFGLCAEVCRLLNRRAENNGHIQYDI